MTRANTPIPWLELETPLPQAHCALGQGSDIPGLVAAGGGLSVTRLVEAYSSGIFPWFSAHQPILWWSPDPRMVLDVRDFKVSRSFRKTLQSFVASPGTKIMFDHDFSTVIRHCARAARPGQDGTWIVDAMVHAYEDLHASGHAHSVETWIDGRLVGGLYCVSIGHCIFGESMFSLQNNASKIALAALVAFARTRGAPWIDCQQNTRHLASLGAQEVPRSQFIDQVMQGKTAATLDWHFEPSQWSEILPSKAPE